jgi:hypothetical protein
MKTNKKPVKLTPAQLRNLIEVEVKKGFGDIEDVEKREKDTEVVDADEFGTEKAHERHVDWQKAATGDKSMSEGFDKCVDYLRALKVEEQRLAKNLKRVQEAKKRAAQYLVSRA